MTALSIQPTYPIFTDIDGQPLEDGYIWIGVVNLAPIVNPITVYWDAALTTPAVQPIRTRGGYPVNSGTPARLYVNGDYSIQVQNKNGSVVYSAPAATERYSEVVVTGLNAADVIYDPPFTGAVQTNVEDKLSQYVSVLDFGADPTGANDSHDAFADAIQTGGTVYVPPGTYIFNSAVTITNSVTIIGAGQNSTNLHRNYSPVNDYDGIFNIRDGGTTVSIQDLYLRSLSGQTGGCLLSLVNTNAQAIGQFTFINVGFSTTGSSTHQYTIYMDGTARTTAPIGIRGVDMFGCSVFGGGISTILAKGILKWSFIGGGTYTAGGAAGSNVRISGSAAVPTQSFQFLPADCSCPISFDYAELGIFSCGIMGAVTNTANTENIYGFGFCGNLQQNWVNSAFFDTSTGLKMTVNQKIGNTGATTNFALEMDGAITGFKQTGSVAKVGQAGVGYSTLCPDTQTFGFANQSGKLFSISTGGGAAALVFADYKSTTITLLSNPSNEFQASAAPGVGYTGIFKSANSHQINVKNNTGSAITYDILNFGNLASTSDPV